MIIDFHTHIYPDKIAKKTVEMLAERSGFTIAFDGTEAGLISLLKNSDVDIAVSLPVLTKPSQFDSVFNYALDINNKYKNSLKRIISFAGIHPDCEDIKGKMKHIKDNGFLGVKIHPDYQNTFIDDDKYYEILKCAKDNDLIVITHSGHDGAFRQFQEKCPPELLKKLIQRVNHDKFVLGHFGSNKHWEKSFDILAGLNVYFDTAFTVNYIDKDLFIKTIEKHGEDKIVFATDCPWQDINDNVNVIKSFNLTEETLQKIFYKNAYKLLKL